MISVIICTYNRSDCLIRLLKSLLSQTFKQFEVIIIDNNSSDDTERVCKEFCDKHLRFHYFKEMRQGSTYAKNTGARYASGELLVFLDDDSIPATDYLTKAWMFHSLTGIVAFGGRIIARYSYETDRYEEEEPAWMSKYVRSLVGEFNYSNRVRVFIKKYPLESNMIVKRHVFMEMGGFNTQLGMIGRKRMGGDGKDFFTRVKKKYMVVYLPYLIVYHVVERNSLTKEYMKSCAEGIGRGERYRIGEGLPVVIKTGEYITKLGAACLIAIGYLLSFRGQKSLPLISFRWNVLRGLFKK